MDEAVKELIEFPNPDICKHYAALIVIKAAGEEKFSKELIRAIIDGDDDTALYLMSLETG